MLEDVSEKVLFEEEQIAQEIASYFQHVFCSSNTVADDVEVDATIARAIQPFITNKITDKLMEIPSTAEIKKHYLQYIRPKYRDPMDYRLVSSKPTGKWLPVLPPRTLSIF